MGALVELSARELVDLYASGQATPVAAVDACLERIEELDEQLAAFTALCAARAREEARAAEAAWRRGEPSGPLCGVPFAVKDIFDTAGLATECGSRVLAGRVPQRDAAAVRLAREQGAILLGKTATHEFAWGLKMHTTRNPWDPERTPGGSSGGSAVAVATGMAHLALGTDTGGSIRLPAALCGVVGFKPTHGTLSLDGCWPLAPSLDHAGPIARTVADAALLLPAESGGSLPPKRSGSSVPPKPSGPSVPPKRSRPSVADPSVPRVGVIDVIPLPAAVRRALDRAAGALGAVPVEWPEGHRWVGAYAPIQLAEALGVHTGAGLWPARRDLYSPSVRGRMERTERLEPAVLAAARAERERLRDEATAVLHSVDLVLSAVCAEAPPPRMDEPGELRETVLPLTTPANLLGLPACSVPAGLDDHGVPVGVQVMGPPGADAAVLAAAQALEDALGRLSPAAPAPRPGAR